jgi:hypothetical protein
MKNNTASGGEEEEANHVVTTDNSDQVSLDVMENEDDLLERELREPLLILPPSPAKACSLK